MYIINFFLEQKVEFGQAVYFVSDILDWQPDRAIRMTCMKVNQWACRVHLFQEEFEYKYFVSSFDQISNIYWEDGENRHLKLNYMPKKINDRWNQRRIIFVVFGLVDQIFVQSNLQNLTFPKKMKKYFKAIYLSLLELNMTIFMDCYLVNQNPSPKIKIAKKKKKILQVFIPA